MNDAHKSVPIFALLVLLACLTPALATEWITGAPFDPPVGAKCYGVASVNFKGRLWIFQNIGTSKLLIRKSSDGGGWLPAGTWDTLSLPQGVTSDTAPALATFEDSIYLFITGKSGHIYYRHTKNSIGTVWSKWSSITGRTDQSVAVAVQPKKLYLFAREKKTGHVNFRTFDGSAWSSWSPTNVKFNIVTNVAPAAMTLTKIPYLFVIGANGLIYASKPPFPNDKEVVIGSEADVYTAPTATLSGKRLFLFVKDKQKQIRYRLLDGTHVNVDGGSVTWIPVHDRDKTSVRTPLSQWMPAGSGYSDSFIAAGALNKANAANDRLFLFTWRNQCVLASPTMALSRPRLFAHWADWTDIPIHVLQAANEGCSDKATLEGFDEMLRYANSTYAPGMIRFKWNPTSDVTLGHVPGTNLTTCNSAWNVNDTTPDADKQITEAANQFPGKVVVLIRRSSGGAGAGFGGFIKFIELKEAPKICGDDNNPYHSLGHEIGHYFSLPHTFYDAGNEVPRTKNALQKRLTSLGNDVSLAFDYDAQRDDWSTWPITDTPPDPFWEPKEGGGTKCVPDPIVFDGDVEPLYPPRTNAMSYYQQRRTSIQKFSPEQFHNVYNYMFVLGFLGNF